MRKLLFAIFFAIPVTYSEINFVDRPFSNRNFQSCDIPPKNASLIFEEETKRLVSGEYSPSDCTPKERIAIIIPYRNREMHLIVFLNYVIEFLMRQRRHFAIIVLEQSANKTFNKGVLLNAGFLETRKLGHFDCFFYHDVDLLPLNIEKFYKCPEHGVVQHWACAIDKFDYRLFYPEYFGGVVAVRSEEFMAVNGYPDNFFGWGYEDDCFYRRVLSKTIGIYRDMETRFTMLRHASNESGNEVNLYNRLLFKMCVSGLITSGLNTVRYTVVKQWSQKSHRHFIIDVPSDRRILWLSDPFNFQVAGPAQRQQNYLIVPLILFLLVFFVCLMRRCLRETLSRSLIFSRISIAYAKKFSEI